MRTTDSIPAIRNANSLPMTQSLDRWYETSTTLVHSDRTATLLLLIMKPFLWEALPMAGPPRPFWVKGGGGRQADGTAGLPPAPEIPGAFWHLRFVKATFRRAARLWSEMKKGQWAIYCRPPAKASRSSRRRSLPAGDRHRSAAARMSVAAAHPKRFSPRSE